MKASETSVLSFIGGLDKVFLLFRHFREIMNGQINSVKNYSTI